MFVDDDVHYVSYDIYHMKHNVHHHQQTSISTIRQINNFEVVKNISMFSALVENA